MNLVEQIRKDNKEQQRSMQEFSREASQVMRKTERVSIAQRVADDLKTTDNSRSKDGNFKYAKLMAYRKQL